MDQEPEKSPEYREYTGDSRFTDDSRSDLDHNPYADAYDGRSIERYQTPQRGPQVQIMPPQSGVQRSEEQYRYDPAALYGYQGAPPVSPVEKHGEPQVERASQSRSGLAKVAGIGSLLVVVGGWLLKLKGLAFLLKFGMPALSALLTVALYSVIFGWAFAFGFVASIFIHEMGHALVMRSKNIPVNGMVFIPFLGAAVFGRRAANARDEAEIGIAGPLAGALAASVCLALAYVQPNSLWAPLAYLGFFINLFNMIPILPLDGGHVLGAVDRRIWIVGFVGLLVFQIWMWTQGSTSWWLLLLVIMAATQIRSLGFSPQTPEERAFYDVPLSTRIGFTVLYFGLAAVLFMGMQMAHAMIPALR